MRKLKLVEILLAAALLSFVIAVPALGAGLNTGAGPWQWLRPPVQGATIYDMDFLDASTGWAVGIGGTILKTTDGGENWASQNSGTNFNLWGVDFVDANHGWAVGDYGTVLHTSDGGETWGTQSVPSPAYPQLTDVSFANGGTGIIVGAGYGYYTTNGGASWTKTVSINTNHWLASVQMSSATTAVAVGSSGVIYKTTDAGATWFMPVSPTSSSLNSVYFTDASRGIAVASVGATEGRLLRTTSGGDGYATTAPEVAFAGGDGTGAAGTATISGGYVTGVTITSNGTGYNSSPAVTFSGGDGTGAAGTATLSVNDIAVTNGGSGYTTAPTVSFTGDGSGATATATLSGDVVTGISVTNGGSGYTTAPTVSFTGDGSGATATATMSVTGVTITDGGVIWEASSTGVITAAPLFAAQVFQGSTADTLVAAGNGGTILRYENANLWTDPIDTVAGNLNSGTVASGTVSNLAAVVFPSSQVGFVAGAGGAISKSADYGATWTLKAGGDAVNLLGSSFDGTQNVWMAGNDSTVIMTDDDGETWNPKNTGISATADMQEIDFQSTTTGFVVGTDAGGGVAYSTSNGGSNWTAMSTPVGTPALYGLSMTSTTGGWAVGAGGTALSTSDGTTWLADNAGIPSDIELNEVDTVSSVNNAWAVGQGLGKAQGYSSVSGGAVTGVTITNGGSGYATAPAVSFSGGGGTGAAGTAVLTGDVVTGVNITDPGSGYISAPAVTLSGGTGAIYKYNGSSWNLATIQDTSPTFMTAIDMFDVNNGYAVGSGGKIYKTADGGSTWQPQVSGTTRLLADVSFSSVSNGFAIGDEGRLIHTRDGGATWSAEDMGTNVSMFTITALGERSAYAGGGNGAVLKALRPYYFTWYDDLYSNDWVLMANPASASTNLSFDLFISGRQQDLSSYNSGVVTPGSSITPKYPGTIGGPVNAASLTSDKAIVSQRILWPKGGSSIEEVLGQDIERLSNHYYWTWYDQASLGYTNWVLIANPNPFAVNYDIRIAGASVSTGTIASGENTTPTFPNTIGGPVEVLATVSGSDAPAVVMASQRVLSNYGTAFNEAPGVPAEELSGDYYWSWYDDVGGKDWILIANPPGAPTSLYYQIYIGGTLVCDDTSCSNTNSPITPGAIPEGGFITPRFGTIGGPVEVKTFSDPERTVSADAIASQRIIFGPSFGETMGYPAADLTNTYHWTWYDQLTAGMRNWVLIANPTGSSVDYEIDIGGGCLATPPLPSNQECLSGTIPAGEKVTPTFPGKKGGPVKVSATGNVIVSQRVMYNGYFNEVLGTVLN